MATRFILTPGSAEFGSATFPQLAIVNTTERIPVLAFDAAVDEWCYWSVVVPQGWTGAVTAILTLLANSVAANADSYWEVSVQAVTPGGGTADDTINQSTTTSYAAVNAGNVLHPTTAYQEVALSITLTNMDSAAAGDSLRIKVSRDANHASDDLAVDALLKSAEIRDSA